MTWLQQRKRLQSEASGGAAEVPRRASQDGDPGTKDGGRKLKFKSRAAVKTVLVFQLAHKEKNSEENAIIPTLVRQADHNVTGVGENVPEYWTSSLAARWSRICDSTQEDQSRE